jgi:hypothetical protein
MLRIAHLALLLLGVVFGLSAHIPRQTAAPNQGATGSVEGRVTVAGQPVAGLALWLVPRNEYQTITETDADGRYRFERVPPEHYWVTAVSRRYVTSGQPTWGIQGV